jgi:ATP-binding cassette subfamily F protein 3
MLNRCVTHTLALEHQQQLAITPGGYDAWLRLRAAKLRCWKASAPSKTPTARTFSPSSIGSGAKASKASQAQSRVKRLEKMQEISIPIAERTTPFSFPSSADKLSPPLLQLRDAKVGYGEEAVILRGVDLRLDPEDRIAIVGANGQGKTTLVKSIAERLPLLAGDRTAPRALRIGYFSQDQMDELRPGETVLQHVQDALPAGSPESKQRAAAAAMGFRP